MGPTPSKSAICRDSDLDLRFVGVVGKIYTKISIFEILGRGLPGRGNVPASRRSMFKLSWGFQLQYMKRTKQTKTRHHHWAHHESSGRNFSTLLHNFALVLHYVALF